MVQLNAGFLAPSFQAYPCVERDQLLLKGTEARSFPKSASLPLRIQSFCPPTPCWTLQPHRCTGLVHPRQTEEGRGEPVAPRSVATSPSLTQAAFSWFPAQPGHKAPPQEVRAVVWCYCRRWTHTNSKQLSCVCFSLNQVFPCAFPFCVLQRPLSHLTA